MQKIAMFDTKPYDRPGFDRYASKFGVEIKYFEPKLNEDKVISLTRCVNDDKIPNNGKQQMGQSDQVE